MRYDYYGNLTSKGSQEYQFNYLTGNLSQRSFKPDGSSFVTENFSYDQDNRLTKSVHSGVTTDSLTYDTRVNITFKAGPRSYIYNQSKINRLDSVSFDSTSVSSADQYIEYNSDNLATLITQDTDSLYLTYGADGTRIKTCMRDNGALQKTKYFSPGYEKEISVSTIRHLNYIYSPFGLVAIIIKQGTTQTLYYVETDHLGSILSLINTNGTKAETYSYDAWGRRRNPTDLSYNNIPDPVLTDRGYTGHEHLDRFDLINMNGRLYDPAIGRFLNVDPLIQSPENAQSYAGYNYCLNNPLKYSDPTGYLTAAQWNQALWLFDNLDNFASANCTWNDDGGGSILGGEPDFNGADPSWSAEQIYQSNVKFYGSYDYAKTGAYISKYDGHTESFAEYYANKIAPELSKFRTDFVTRSLENIAFEEVSYNTASLIGGVAFGRPTSDEGLFNRLATINYLLSHSTLHYITGINGWCSRNVFDALDNGNLCGPHPGYAYLAGPFLQRLGFIPINDVTCYSTSLCDITVFDRNSFHTSGHIQMWCGSEWVSDFRQGYRGYYSGFVQGGLGFSPYSTCTTPTFTIYRRPWWLPYQN